jgi:hypothetical protein
MKFSRILNDEGINKFRSFLDEGAVNGEPVPTELLTKQETSQIISKPLDLDQNIVFSSKLELGKYLDNAFEKADLRRQNVIRNRNLWASMVLLWFDQFCPIGSDGKREVSKVSYSPEAYQKYIPQEVTEHGSKNLHHRHLALTPYRIFERNKLSANQGRCILAGPIHIFGRDIEAVSGRAEVFSNSELIETIHMLYWDETKRKLRRGYSTETRPGNIHRLLADVRNQRKKTQDWYSMTARQIVASLPEEFDYWKNLRR